MFFEPLIIGYVLNIIQEKGVTDVTIGPIIKAIGLYILLYFGFWAFHGPARVIEITNAFIVRANYKKFLLEGTLDLPPQWHTDHHSGNTIDKIEKGTIALFNFSEETFLIVESMVRLVSSYIALVYFNVHASYIVLFVVLFTIWVILRFDRILIKQYKQLNSAENEITAKVFDIISNSTTVIVLRIEKLVNKAMFKKIMKPFDLFKKNQRINETKWFVVTVCSTVMVFLVLSSYIYFTYKSGAVVLAGTVYILYGYVDRISNLFYRFAYNYGDIVKNRTAVANAEEISSSFKNKKRASRVHDWSELVIEDLRFSYKDSGSQVHLDNVSMKIKRNQRIAVIGESGSGKTTFLKIIRDLYTPDNVVVHLDGKRFKYGFNSISNDVTLIPQDPEIFSTTIKENITLGAKVSMKDILKYTDMARFTEVASKLPRKFNSSIVEKGVNLSGGQKQRLALSRGLLASKNKSIVLLDEPTSSVDMKNELLIYKNIFREFKDKTIISSIHRLHLLYLFDVVYFFDDGKIVARGTFDELLKNSEAFMDLWIEYNEANNQNK